MLNIDWVVIGDGTAVMDQKFIRGLGTGAIAVAALVVFAPAIASSARPLVRRGMKEAIKAISKGREAAAEFQELAEDAYAEAISELESEAEAAKEEVAAEAAAAEEATVEPKKKKR
jgi:hypothetical protein